MIKLNDQEEMKKMMAMIYEFIINPIAAASGGNVSGVEIIGKVFVFLLILFLIVYGLPMWLVALV